MAGSEYISSGLTLPGCSLYTSCKVCPSLARVSCTAGAVPLPVKYRLSVPVEVMGVLYMLLPRLMV